MHILDKISELLLKAHKTQKELCVFLGVGKQAFSDWKSGKSNSYTKYLPKIAEFFDVSVDFLLDNGYDPAKSTHNIIIRGRDGTLIEKNLTDDQIELIARMVEQFDKK